MRQGAPLQRRHVQHMKKTSEEFRSNNLTSTGRCQPNRRVMNGASRWSVGRRNKPFQRRSLLAEVIRQGPPKESRANQLSSQDLHHHFQYPRLESEYKDQSQTTSSCQQPNLRDAVISYKADRQRRIENRQYSRSYATGFRVVDKATGSSRLTHSLVQV